MLAILAATALGYWCHSHIGMHRDPLGLLSLEVHTAGIGDDIARFWSAFLAVCAWSINAGRNARRFVDTVRPWLAALGLSIPELPTLPQVPATSQGAIAQPIKRQTA